MSIFDELQAQYVEIDNQYSSLEFEVRTNGWSRKEQKYQRKRKLNDQAYFLFIFSRLEDRIRTQTSALIKKKKITIQSWRQRAAWDILPSSASADYPFKKCLAFLARN